jgi:ABC-type transporter Mla subunit MlaD
MKKYLIGVLFFILVGVAFYLTIIQRVDSDRAYPYRAKLYFARADGIHEGTEVRILGVSLGTVLEVRKVDSRLVADSRFLEPGKTEAIELHIALTQPVTLWNNYKVDFQTITVFSGRIIDIDPGYFEKDKRSSYFFYPTSLYNAQPSDFPISAKYYDDFFLGANELLQENRYDLRRITSNLRIISDKLKSENGTVPKIINSDEMYNNLDETITDSRIIGKEFRRYIEMVRENDSVLIPFTINLFRNTVFSVNNN